MNPKDKINIGGSSNIADDKSKSSQSSFSTGSAANPRSNVGGSPTGAGVAPAREKDFNIGTTAHLEPGRSESSVNQLNKEAKSSSVVDQVSSVASDLANKVSENYGTIRDTAGDYFNSVSSKVTNYSKNNPGYAILASVGVGLLVGYMLAPRRPRYDATVRCLINDSLNLIMDRYF